MEKISKTYRLFFVCILLALCGAACYFFYFRNEVENALLGNPSPLLNWLIQTFYPRLLIEQNRFEPEFFLQKTDLILYRACGIMLIASFAMGYFRNPLRKEKLQAFLVAPSNQRTYTFLLFLFILLSLLIWQEVYWFVLDRLTIASFYQRPSPFYPTQYPSEFWIHAMGITWFMAIASMAFPKTRIAGAGVSACLFIWMQGFYFGFEKIDHSFYTYFWIILCLPFYFLENKNHFTEHSWALRWMQVLIALTYIFSALEKLTISGWSWFAAENLQTHLWVHQIPAGIWIAQYPSLCSFLLAGSLAIQLSFFVILFFRKYTWLALTGGIIFHMSTYFLMNIGHWINPWILVYVVFIYWNEKRS